jgi:hypothetical protein
MICSSTTSHCHASRGHPTSYGFKKKVLLAMKSRYRKITGRRVHSGDVVSGDEDVSAVDSLAVKLSSEMQSALDKQEAAHQEVEVLKARKVTISKILVPPPPPDVSLEIVNQTQQSAAV